MWNAVFGGAAAPPGAQFLLEVVEVQGLILDKKKSRLPCPFVQVTVGTAVQSVGSRETTASCTFNKQMLFSNASPEEVIQVTVSHKGVFGAFAPELIGSYSTSVADLQGLVREQGARFFGQVLAPLTRSEAPSEPRGFVRLRFAYLEAGQEAPLGDGGGAAELAALDGALGESQAAAAVTSSQQQRIVNNPDLVFENYIFEVNVFYAQGLQRIGDAAPSTFVRGKFAGLELRTSTMANSASPIWNESLRFPAAVPAAADKLTLELNDAARSLTLGSVSLSFGEILRRGGELRPRWMNFYWVSAPGAPPGASQYSGAPVLHNAFAAVAALLDREDSANADEFDFAIPDVRLVGRLLVSAACTRVPKVPKSHLAPCAPVEPPPEVRYLLWVDLYELLLPGPWSEYMIDLSFGPTWFKRFVERVGEGAPESSLKTYQGRLPDHQLSLPSALSTAPDFIIKVHARTRSEFGFRLVAVSRIPAADLARKNGLELGWLEFDQCLPAFPAALLLSVYLNREDSVRTRNLARPPRAEVGMRTYELTAACIAAINLPIASGNRVPMPHYYAVVNLGSSTFKTRTVYNSTCPAWNEVLTFSCALPENVDLARPLTVKLYSGNILVGHVRMAVADLMHEQRAAADAGKKVVTPKWRSVESVRFPKNKAKLLCGFTLASPDSPPMSLNAAVDFEPVDVQMYVLGARLFSAVVPVQQRPPLKTGLLLEFGRDTVNPNIRLWKHRCDVGVRGAPGMVDFLHTLELKCFLPKNPAVQSYLDVKVLALADGPMAASSEASLGLSHVHLTSALTQLDPRLRHALAAVFAMHHPAVPGEKRTDALSSDMTDLLAPFFVPGSCPGGETRSAAKLARRRLEAVRNRRTRGVVVSDAIVFVARRDSLSGAESAEDVSAALALVSKMVPPGAGAAAATAASALAFWGVDEAEAAETRREPRADEPVEIAHSLEAAPQFRRPGGRRLLPFVVAPIFAGAALETDPSGRPRCLGVLKLAYAAFTAEQQEEKRDFRQRMQALDAQWAQLPPLKVRVHVLSASGLTPLAGEPPDEAEWFVAVRTARKDSDGGGGGGGATRVVEDRSYTFRGLSPDIYRSFELDCSFPDAALLSIEIVRAASLWVGERSAGYALIDLENRWWSAVEAQAREASGDGSANELSLAQRIWQGGVIERVDLRDAEFSDAFFGRLKVRVDLLTAAAAALKPMVPLAMPVVEVVQVRIVVWQIRGLPADGQSVSPYVIALMADASGQVNQQMTDTHWNCDSGAAKFNWRFVFDVPVPSEAGSSLRLQVWNKSLLGADASLAEVLLELSGDLDLCRASQSPVELRRSWMRLRGDGGGAVDVEIQLLPQALAAASPVGLGRDEPNENPFLPPVDDESRGFIESSPLVKRFFNASSNVAFTARLVSWGVAFALAATIFYLFRKVFLEW